MDTSMSTGKDGNENPSKKSPVDAMSREELVTKCKNMLALLQKHKRDKEEMLSENRKIKEQNFAAQEMIESLMQIKVDFTQQTEILKKQSSKIESLEIENESFKRQIKRLTDENEQLYGDLQVAGQQSVDLENMGKEQQQLLNSKLSEETSLKKEDSGLPESPVGEIAISNEKLETELQSMLSRSLKEVQVLRDENLTLQSQIRTKSNQDIQNRDDKIASLNELINTLNTAVVNKDSKIGSLINELENVNVELHIKSEEITKINSELQNCKETSQDLKISLEKSNSKLQIYRKKIIKFSSDLKNLRESKEFLLKTVKDYSDHINKWKTKIQSVTDLMAKISEESGKEKEVLENENTQLKTKYETLEIDYKKLKEGKNAVIKDLENLMRNNEELLKQIQEKEMVDSDKDKLELQAKVSKMENQNIELNRKLNDMELISGNEAQEIIILQEKNASLLKNTEKLTSELESTSKKILNLETLLQNKELEMGILENERRTIWEQLESIKIEKNNEAYLGELKELKNSVEYLTSKCNLKQEENAALLADIAQLKQGNLILKEDLEKETNVFKNENQNLRQQIESMESKLQNEIDNTLKLKQEMNQLKENAISKQVELKELENEIDVLKNDIKIKQELIRTSEEKCDSNNEIIYKLQQEKNDSEKLIAKLEKQIFDHDNEKEEQIELLEQQNLELTRSVQSQKNQNDCQLLELQEKSSENSEIINELNQKLEQQKFIENELRESKHKNNELLKTIESQKMFENEVYNLRRKNEELLQIISNLEQTDLKYKSELTEIQIKMRALNEQLSIFKRENQQLAEGNSDLQLKNDKLTLEIENMRQINNECAKLEERCVLLSKELSISKTENSELLSDMNKMNQELKQRGEIISKREEEICEFKKLKDISKKNDSGNDLVKEKEEIIQQLNAEIVILKEKINNLDNQTEIMSTSTISRADEANRLSELEGTWEDRYSKLKTLAIRLKKQSADRLEQLSAIETERNELQQKLVNTTEELQELQKKYETLSLEKKQEISQTAELGTVDKVVDLSKSAVESLQSEIETLRKDESNLNNTVEEYKKEIQNLKEEYQKEIGFKRDLENKIAKFELDFKTKEKQLQDEIDKHKKTKEQLAKSNKECKNKSILSLEIEDYERSHKEMSEKLERKKQQIESLEESIKTQSSTVVALQEQIKVLDNSIAVKDNEVKKLKEQLNAAQAKITEIESLSSRKDNTIDQLEHSLELKKSECEKINLELTKIVGEKQKQIESFKNEKENLKGTILRLEEKVRSLTAEFKSSEQEVSDLRSDFEGYKVRVKSVLNKKNAHNSPTYDSQEVVELRAEVSSLQAKLDSALSKLKISCEELSSLQEEKQRLQAENQELITVLQELRTEHDTLIVSHSEQVSNHLEELRAQRLRNDTLAQCYRQQIGEMEEKYNKEISNLKEKLFQRDQETEKMALKKPPSFMPARFGNLDDKVDVACMEREEGEGSESVDSSSSVPLHHGLIPLDQLLSVSTEDGNKTPYTAPVRAMSPTTELRNTKQQLTQHETKITHLTALLSDAEQDLAKLQQLNYVLKEDIRRHQRSVEREELFKNLEYLKNVVFKFITLGSGDEKSHLVPVLNTILKLSPEETQKLNYVAKGLDPSGGRSWGSYLPLPKWHGAQKPQ